MCHLFIMSIMMVITVEGGLWEGHDMFEGVGLGLGKVTRPFKAEIYIEEGSIQGVGTDESGEFRLEGSVDGFSKIYNEQWCDSIEYQGLEVNQRWINGTYR